MISQTKLEKFNSKFDVVSCFVEHNGRFLLLHRQDHKPQGGTWGVPAGKVHDGEDLKTALLREVQEEIGLVVTSEDLKFFRSYFVRYSDYDFMYHIFSVTLNTLPELYLHADEHKDFKWVIPTEALSFDLIQDEDFCIKAFYKI